MGLSEAQQRCLDAYNKVYGGGWADHQVTTEVLAHAADYMALEAYGQEVTREGTMPSYWVTRKLLDAYCAAEIDRLFDGSRFTHIAKHEARAVAYQQAIILLDELWAPRGYPDPTSPSAG